MKVSIIEHGKKRSFAIPNFLLLNRVAINNLNNATKDSDVKLDIHNISSNLASKLRKTIRQMRKIHKDWVFVDVCSGDGSRVIVKLQPHQIVIYPAETGVSLLSHEFSTGLKRNRTHSLFTPHYYPHFFCTKKSQRFMQSLGLFYQFKLLIEQFPKRNYSSYYVVSSSAILVSHCCYDANSLAFCV